MHVLCSFVAGEFAVAVDPAAQQGINKRIAWEDSSTLDTLAGWASEIEVDV
jgi:hypothetical protein